MSSFVNKKTNLNFIISKAYLDLIIINILFNIYILLIKKSLNYYFVKMKVLIKVITTILNNNLF